MRWAILLSSGLLAVTWPTRVFAITDILVADDDPAFVNSFTVTFPPELGGETQVAEIPATVYSIEVDEELGTARLLTYFQEVNPLDLLGFSTGKIRVIRSGVSSGTYDAVTGAFSITDTYLVFFDDTVLRDFGFTSPFAVPSTLSGTLVGDDATMQTGTIATNWGGVGEVENIFDENNPYLFTYTCSVNSKFDATTTVLQAKNNPAATNEFTVNFPVELGGETQTAAIPSTEFVLEVDEANGEGRLLSWAQTIDPFDLLGFSTGVITVGLGGVSTGVFDSTTGVFTTSEIYDVFFDDTELSAFGFVSPFSIPSNSTGTVKYLGDAGGTISMDWSGEGEVSNPADPENPYIFTYSCAVSSTFGAPALCPGDLNADGAVDPLDSGYVLARLGCSAGTGDAACDAADANLDGTVDPLDVGYVMARFATCN